MTATALGTLAVLALIDSTSFGTLLIPVWLLTAPGRLRAGRILAFLGVVAGAYFCIGLALMFGATTLYDTYGHLLHAREFLYAQLGLGVALFILRGCADRRIYCGRPGVPLAVLSSLNARSSALFVVRLAMRSP